MRTFMARPGPGISSLAATTPTSRSPSSLYMAIEEHGAGGQLLRFRCLPRLSPGGVAVVALFTALAVATVADRAWLATGLLEGVAAVLGLRGLGESGGAELAVVRAPEDAGAQRA